MTKLIPLAKSLLKKENKNSSSIVKVDQSQLKVIGKNADVKKSKSIDPGKLVKINLPNNQLNFKIKKVNINKDILLEIESKVIQIDKFLKNSLLLKKKEVEVKRKVDERKEFAKREKDLEKEKPKIGGLKLPALPTPKLGIFDWIKNFIFNTLLGFLAIRLIDHLPKLLNILPFLMKVADSIIDISGKLLDGLVTFIDWGYKAYDSTRGFVKNIFGKDGVKQFDQLSGLLNKFLNLAIIAGMLSAGSGGGFGGKGRGGGGGKGSGVSRSFGFGGRPSVTVSGGSVAGRPDLRNPLRQRSRVTSSGGGAGRLDLRNPLRQRPRVTTGAGGGLGGTKGILSTVRPFLKTIRVPVIAALIDFGLSWALGENPGRAAFRAIGAAILGTIGGGLAGALGLAGGPLAIATAALGAIAGGTLGDMAGGALYDLFFGGKKPKTPRFNKLAGGGRPEIPTPKGVGVSSRNPVRRTLKRKKKSRTLAFTPRKIRPGRSAGGEGKVQSVFPNTEKPGGILGFLGGIFGGNNEDKTQAQPQEANAKKANPQEFLIRSNNDNLGKSPNFGAFATIFLKSVLGDQPDKLDYLNAAKGLNYWMQGIFKTSTLGFAGGGEVDTSQFFRGEDYTKVIAKSIEDSVSDKVDSTIRDLAKEMRLGAVGREEQIQKNINPDAGVIQKSEPSDPNLQVGPAGTVTGGNADFWTLVAIASREDGDPQGWADVAQSIYNRVASGVYGAKTIKGIVTSQSQYEPTWKYPKYGTKNIPNSQWHNIKDAQTASIATGMSVSAMQSVASALRNKKYQDEAAKFVGGRTDFMGGSNQPGPGDVRRKENAPNNFFGWFVGPGAKSYGAKNPGPAKAPQLGNIIIMGGGDGSGAIAPVKGGKAFPLPKGMIGTESGQVYGAPRSYGGHAGVDLVEKQPWGKDPKIPAVSFASGKVISNGPKYSHKTSGYTSNLTIDHGSFKATYLHMKPALSPGAIVSPGQKVGNLIDLGNQTHLHFESYDKSGSKFNPTSLLRSAYEKGGETPDTPTMALIGENGTEFVIAAEPTKGIERLYPGFLSALNSSKYEEAIEILQNYTEYEQPIIEREFIEIPVDISNPNNSSYSGSSYLYSGSSVIDNVDYEILEML